MAGVRRVRVVSGSDPRSLPCGRADSGAIGLRRFEPGRVLEQRPSGGRPGWLWAAPGIASTPGRTTRRGPVCAGISLLAYSTTASAGSRCLPRPGSATVEMSMTVTAQPLRVSQIASAPSTQPKCSGPALAKSPSVCVVRRIIEYPYGGCMPSYASELKRAKLNSGGSGGESDDGDTRADGAALAAQNRACHPRSA